MSIVKIKDPRNIMDRGTDTIIMVVVIITPSITEDTGDHGENGMIIEDITVNHIEMVTITEKTEVFILSLKMKTVGLYFLSDSNI